MTKHDFTKDADQAMKAAVAKVMERHRKSGRPVAIWKDGRVQHVMPKAPKTHAG